MQTPYIICHMATTINGKILTANWGDDEKIKSFYSLYEQCHQSFNAQAWMCGRVTMEKDFASDEQPGLTTPEIPIARQPFIGDKNATSFAIAIDAKGKLFWNDNEVNGDHIIEMLTEVVSDSYLHYLQQKNISYIFAGAQELDLAHALYQLSELFPIKTIMLEGGGYVNASFLNEGLIDELSILLLPIADSAANTPTAFELGDYLQQKPAVPLQLKNVQQLGHDVLWVRYGVDKK